jgi:3-oxoacyl-[acyl-carrier protein] reductase
MSNHPIVHGDATLEGSTALVTGAGSGIGKAAALALARQGADVVLMGRRLHRLREAGDQVAALGRRAFVSAGDVGSPDDVEAAVARSRDELGPPQVVVASAGVNAWGALDELTPESLREALATNVEGVANVARAVVPSMVERGHGKFIVIASDNGRVPEPEGSGYVASKFGAVGFSLSLSRELYRTGVSVHILEPGCVDTEWYEGDDDVPRERMLSPEDVAELVVFLATLPTRIVLEELMVLPRGLLADPWD